MRELAFDYEKYIKLQSQKILERVNRFDKLYLEFGGKLFDDSHAARVLPGFPEDVKVKMLKELADQAEIILTINAQDIEKSKKRGDLGITYDQDVLRLIDAFTGYGLYVSSVVITQYENTGSVSSFKKKLERLGVKVYLHYYIKDYPNDVDRIVSQDGFGRNEYVETTRPLVVVTAPGPGSGKMAVCLSQLYHEHQHGIYAGYSKFETFPIFNLPLSHPVNLAYEAATIDLGDVNMIDPYHLEKYGISAVNYNRDVEIFPVLSRILKEITGEDIYYSPTDMGVNMIGLCISNDQAARRASNDEIIRRYYRALVDYKAGLLEESALNKILNIMAKAEIKPQDRRIVEIANNKASQTNNAAVAIELNDGTIITGKTSSLLNATSAAILNALKYICHIDDDVLLLSPKIIEPVQILKLKYLGNSNPRLHADETLLALSVSSQSNDVAAKCMAALPQLKNCQIHSTVILLQSDADTVRKLGMDLTCDANYQTKKLFHGEK